MVSEVYHWFFGGLTTSETGKVVEEWTQGGSTNNNNRFNMEQLNKIWINNIETGGKLDVKDLSGVILGS